MDERDTLAALLHELGVGCMQPFATTRDVCVPTDPRYADFHPALADRLLVAGVRVAPSPDAPGLREALTDAVWALGFHNSTPTGIKRECDPECLACAAIAEGHAALALPPRDALDVERLARAIHAWHNPGSAKACREDSRCRHEAAAIAREYAAQSKETPRG